MGEGLLQATTEDRWGVTAELGGCHLLQGGRFPSPTMPTSARSAGGNVNKPKDSGACHPERRFPLLPEAALLV